MFHGCLLISVLSIIAIILLIVNSKKHIAMPNHGRGWLEFTLTLTLTIEIPSTTYFVNMDIQS